MMYYFNQNMKGSLDDIAKQIEAVDQEMLDLKKTREELLAARGYEGRERRKQKLPKWILPMS